MAFPEALKKNPLIVALDVDQRDRALELVRQIGEAAGAYKIGPRLIQRFGETIVREVAAVAPVFVDCKYFDIPSTMVSAVRASFEAGATLVTVHAQAGSEALAELARLEAELNKVRPFQILCVTILTSFSPETLPSILRPQPIRDHVKDLARLVKESGLRGVVCSPEELSDLRDQGLDLVTPGIRFPLEEKGDQKRVMGPDEAMRAGASAVVVGRPILGAANPREAALDYAVALLQRK